jgi:Arylsulfotransferase (ASST)
MLNPRTHRRLRLALQIVLPLPCLLVIICPTSAPATPLAVYTFPVAGARVASPTTQIAFRGVPVSQFGSIAVTGSRSGAHTGKVLADSDNQGGSFLPSKPFSPGEVVTVSTNLNVVGATSGTFSFTVAQPAGGIPPSHWPKAVRNRNDVWRYRSRPDLVVPALTITKRRRTAPGDIFLGPQFGPIQVGPMILDSDGNPIWFRWLRGNDSPADVRVQSYLGQPVLTWWQGYVTGGVGVGEDVINDSSYRQIATVRAANGMSADLHEFEITPQGTALITAAYPVYGDVSGVHGSKHGIVYDSVVQEIDIPTGLVLFQWDSLDHVPITDSYQKLPKRTPFDYFHVNSIEADQDDDLVISARNTWAAYKVDRHSGQLIWTLGGRHSSFKMGRGASFAFQHDVRVRAGHDSFVTLFDDGAGPPNVHGQSRGIKLFLDLKHMTATRAAEFDHSPALLAGFEGNYQQLSNGDELIGWGQQPYFSEFNSRGQVVFDGHFIDGDASYRVYRFQWTATPHTLPAIAASRHGRSTVVYASWNGATNVSWWRVLGGSSATAMHALATVHKWTFEASIKIGSQRYVAVQALDGRRRPLATSTTLRTR